LISDVRIVKSTAVYTGAFTRPSAPLTAIANTQLLTCNDPVIKDSSLNALTISTVGTVAVDNTTVSNVLFDGTNDYADCGYNSSIYNLTQNLTVEVWVRWTGAVATSGNGQWIVTNVDVSTTNGGFQLGYIPGTGFYFGTYGNLIAATYSFVPVINTWYNLTGIKSSSSGYFIYLNGVSVATNVNLTAGGAASRNLRIAHRERDGAGGYFPGNVSSVKIHNTALTADQVLQNYNALRGRYGL
jgi:hypothetical protein